ncbi:hypothetical protein PQO03_12035 [Lentisphaera profundi]|uniref:PDZ domain-containing protein n=1 Tax=Lentisphaera profundi TaxID=1658616 RepID=A0ABY7VXN8_9BACT|nr:PDZ domain-containing protein [Lentisphaera profundi]WDE98569.1 hypothetical protein PQO03_12035 [Lentisphaera profundi]
MFYIRLILLVVFSFNVHSSSLEGIWVGRWFKEQPIYYKIYSKQNDSGRQSLYGDYYTINDAGMKFIKIHSELPLEIRKSEAEMKYTLLEAIKNKKGVMVATAIFDKVYKCNLYKVSESDFSHFSLSNWDNLIKLCRKKYRISGDFKSTASKVKLGFDYQLINEPGNSAHSLVVTSVSKYSPADQGGMKRGDKLITFNKKNLSTESELKKIYVS